jgi:chromosome segregation ATPase
VSASAELKQELLRLLREDEEFRLTVAGLIGLDSILGELRKLREDFLVFVKEQEERWKENNKRWEELNRRWEENNKRWEENNRRWEENEKRWEENWRRWRENDKKWEEAFKRFEELEKRVSRVELSLGALTEVTLTRYAWEDVREDAKLRGEEVTARLRSVAVEGFEVDMLVETNRRVYVVEVKVRPTVDDVRGLLAKAEVVERKYGKQVVPVLVGALIGDDVRAFAKGKAVEVYCY